MTSPSAHTRPPASADPACPPNPGRARPLPPDERRAALVAATLPLVVQFGPNVTTRQIAEAAGVAEGTIFRVFPDKEALIQAAVSAVVDPGPVLDELAGVDPALPLRERLVAVTSVLQQRMVQVISLMTAIRMHTAPAAMEHHRMAVRPTNELIYEAIARVIEPDRDRFRCPVEEVAHLLRLLTFSGSHHLINEGRPLTAEQIVSVVLDGVCRRADDPPPAADTQTTTTPPTTGSPDC